MTIVQLIETSQSWLVWLAIGLAALALLSFLFKWDIRFRLIGATIFTTLLCGSCWAFVSSYTPPFKVEGALYAPIVYDNGNDLVIAQASKDFPKESIQPTLEQIAGNLKGGGRKRQNVIVRLRKVQSSTEGIDNPIIIGEVIRNINEGITTNSTQEYE
mgnify:CR=1 FL=1